MFSQKLFIASFVFIVFTALFISTAFADLGQVAGGLVFNVSVGSSNTLNWTVINTGSNPINYNIVPPVFTPIANETTPIVIITPLNGTIAPHSQIKLLVTVIMPSNDKPGYRWDNIAQIIGAGSQTTSGGATIQAGLGKEIVITSIQSKSNLILYAIVGIVIIAIAGGSYLAYKKMKGSKARKKTVQTRKTRKVLTKKKKSTRKKASRRGRR